MSELCLHVAVNNAKNSVKIVWKEGTFFLSLFSQMQNWKLKIAPKINGLIVSDFIPKNQSFFWSDSDKIPNSGKHLVRNCTCQLRVVVQLKKR
jgi:hypothetical protein